MVRNFFVSISLAAILILSSCSASRKVSENSGASGNLIIYYEPETGNDRLLKAAKSYGSKVLYVYKNFNGIAVTILRNKTVSDARIYYEKVKGVLSVAEDRKLQLD